MQGTIWVNYYAFSSELPTTTIAENQSTISVHLTAVESAGYVRFIRQIVLRLVYDGRGSLCWCHTRPQPAARRRCSKAVAAWCTTSARKAHLRMTLEDEVRRGVGPRLLVLMARLLVVWNFGSLARWVRDSIPPLTLNCIILVAGCGQNPFRCCSFPRLYFSFFVWARIMEI